MESTKSVYTNNVLKSMTLENFKCFHQPVKIDFSQITMLYGPNSAGKSSILQAICYIAEVLNGNLDVDITSHGGEGMDLGGFQNLLYNHDLNNTMKIGFELDLNYVTVDDFVKFEDINNYASVNNIFIQIEISYSDYEHHPYVSKIKYLYNQKYKLGLNVDKDLSKPYIALHAYDEADMFDYELNDDEIEKTYDELFSDYSQDCIFIEVDGKNKLGALPRIKKDDYFRIFDDDTDVRTRHVLNLIHIPLNILRTLTKQYRFLGPIRNIPPRNFMPQKSHTDERWADGMAAWDAIQNMSDDEFSLLNKFLGEEYLNSGYRFRKKELSYIATAFIKNMTSESFNASIINNYKIDTKQWVLWDEKNNIEVKPHDIGVGISQLLPFLIAMIHDIRSDGIINMVAIEQPELHIHPKMQVELGDVLINRAQMGMPLFIESHSEHILLRLLKRIRQTTNDEVPPERKQLYPENLSILYVNPSKDNNQSPQIYKLRVDSNGSFIDPWPEGFFGERGKELFG